MIAGSKPLLVVAASGLGRVGAAVLRDVPAGQTWAGVPARAIG